MSHPGHISSVDLQSHSSPELEPDMAVAPDADILRIRPAPIAPNGTIIVYLDG